MSGVMLRLDGKVALVTGGSRGIGAATVRMFRQAGARVVFSYQSARETAEALAAELGGADVCRALQQTLATPEDGRALIAAAVAAFGRLDCLVVNHGVWPAHDQPIHTMPDAQWRSTLAINLDSVFGLVQAGVAQMLTQPLPGTGPHRPDRFHGGAARRGVPCGLCRQQGRADLADQEPFERARRAGNLCELRGAGVGRDRDVAGRAERSGDVRKDRRR